MAVQASISPLSVVGAVTPKPARLLLSRAAGVACLWHGLGPSSDDHGGGITATLFMDLKELK